MKRAFTTIAVILLASALQACAARADENIAPRCEITAQYPLPNALWTPVQVADGETGPIKGWLAYWRSSAKPWIRFKLPARATITGMEVMPATFPETGASRFSRPHLVTLEFFTGKNSEKLAFELSDDEQRFQTIEFEPREADEIMITIESVYAGGARISDVTGFQEVRIFTPGPAAPGDGKSAPPRNPDADSLNYDGAGQGAATGTLSSEEKEILDLLRALIEKLERRFLQD